MGLHAHDFAALWLEQRYGVESVRLEIQDGSWVVEVDLPSEEALVTAVELAQNVEPGVERVTVLTPGLPREPVELDLDDYDRYAERIEQGAAAACIATLEFRHQATRAGACLLTEQDVEFAVAVLAKLLVDGQTELVAPLRQARQLAQKHQMDHLARLAALAIATLRSGNTSAPLAQIESRLAAADQPEPPTGPVVTVHLSAQPRKRSCDK